MSTSHTRSILVSLLALGALVPTVGCGGGAYLYGGGRPVLAEIPHPAKTDPSQFGPLVQEVSSIEQRRGLPPGTLANESRLVRADPEAVCFEVTLRGLEPRATDLGNWEIQVRSSEGVYVDGPQIQQSQPSVVQMQGLVPETTQVGSETVCAETDRYGNCMRWVNQPIMSTQWVPGVVDVATASGSVCFPNAELLSLQTTALALRLNGGRALGAAGIWSGQATPAVETPTRLTFQWNFAPDTVAPTTTSGGQVAAR
jgi:hypothetical protein